MFIESVFGFHIFGKDNVIKRQEKEYSYIFIIFL